MIERLLGIDPESSLTGRSLHFRVDWPLMILALAVLAILALAGVGLRHDGQRVTVVLRLVRLV